MLACDLRDAGAVERGVGAAVERLGGLDVLINNAGLGIPQSAGRAPDEQALAVLDVNLIAPWRVTAAALPHLRASRGRVVNVASGLAHLAVPFATAYCMSKRGLVAYSDALRLEHGDEITVTTVYPGYIRTRHPRRRRRTSGVGLEGAVPAERVEDAARALARAALGRPVRDLATTRAGTLQYFLARRSPRRLLDRITNRAVRRLVRAGASPRAASAASSPRAFPRAEQPGIDSRACRATAGRRCSRRRSSSRRTRWRWSTRTRRIVDVNPAYLRLLRPLARPAGRPADLRLRRRRPDLHAGAVERRAGRRPLPRRRRARLRRRQPRQRAVRGRVEVATGRRLVLFVALSTSRWGGELPPLGRDRPRRGRAVAARARDRAPDRARRDRARDRRRAPHRPRHRAHARAQRDEEGRRALARAPRREGARRGPRARAEITQLRYRRARPSSTCPLSG